MTKKAVAKVWEIMTSGSRSVRIEASEYGRNIIVYKEDNSSNTEEGPQLPNFIVVPCNEYKKETKTAF